MSCSDKLSMPVQSQKNRYTVPFDMLSEEWALRNHDQTLRELRARGGMSAFELLCNIDGQKLHHRRPLSDDAEDEELMGRVKAHASPPLA